MENDFTQPEYSKRGSFTQLVLPHYYDVLIPEDDSVRLLSQNIRGARLFEITPGLLPFGKKTSGFTEKSFQSCHIRRDESYFFEPSNREVLADATLILCTSFKGNLSPITTRLHVSKKDRLPKSIDYLFNQFTRLLQKIQEITFETLYVDGTKVEANANRYTFVWRKSVEKVQCKANGKSESVSPNSLC